MKRFVGYPSYFYFFVLLVTASVVFTGLIMTPSSLEFKFNWALSWRLSGSLWPLVAGLHAIVGWLLWMILGAMWPIHMRANWRKNSKRISGGMLSIGIFALGASAIGLYYSGSEYAQQLNALVHLMAGAAFIMVFSYHGIIASRFTRNQ